MKNIIALIVCGLALQTYGDDMDIDLPPVEQSLPSIPGLEYLFPANVSLTQLTEASERADEVLRDKCVRNGGERAFDIHSQGRLDLVECVKGLFNVTHILEEVEKHKYMGDLEIVFRKECGKRETLLGCITNFTEAMDGCLDEEEKSHKVLVNNITSQLFNFVCHKEGDRIALFIAEKGPECLKDKQSAVLGCVNATYPKLFDAGSLDMPSLPMLTVTSNHCTEVDIVQCCIVQELETCEESTPANVIESVMKFVRRATPCNRNIDCHSGTTANVSSYSLLLVISCVSLLRWVWG